MALTRVKLEELIAAGEIEVGGGGVNANILHNWDFRNPVNQRGVSGTITTGTYFYDRWLRNNGTVTTNAAYLTIGASAEIEQRIEGNLLAGETVTVSVMVGGTVFSGTGIMPTSAGTVSVTVTGWGTATLGYATGYMYLRLAPTAASNVQRVKLEMGAVSTLAYDPPMEYGTELFKCRRFFIKADTINKQPYTVETDYLNFFYELPVVMRAIAPTIIIVSGTLAVFPYTVQSGFTFAGTGIASGDKFYVHARKTSHGLNPWACYASFAYTASADL